MQPGTLLPTFNLKGTDGLLHLSSNFKDSDVLVVIFTCNHCPYARAYIQRIARLVDEFEAQPVQIVAINSNDPTNYPEDSFEKMAPMAKMLNLSGLYLFDDTQEVATNFSAQRTPEVFVFDSNRKLAYHGAIDDNWDKENEVENQYLKNAIEALLEGRSPEVVGSKPIGCTIKWK